MQVRNLENNTRHITKSLGAFSVLEYDRDLSVASFNAMEQYFMGQMGMRKRQVVISLNGRNSAVIQAGAMQWMAGNVVATSGIKGVVTKETGV